MPAVWALSMNLMESQSETWQSQRSASSPVRGSTDRTAGILFQGNVYGGAGAEENRAVALGLARAGESTVQLAPRDLPGDQERRLPDSVRAGIERLTRQRVELARSVLYQAGSPDEWNLDYYGGCRVGRAAFCGERIPESWVRRCNAMDEVWVPNESSRTAFERSGVEAGRICVVHTGVDTQIFRPGLAALEIPYRRDFQFLSFTELRRRKWTDVLLTAYLEEFQADEDVALILGICGRNGADGNGAARDAEAEVAFFIEREMGLRLEDTATVILVDMPSVEEERARIYAAADAFVVTERAVVSGQRLLEAIASGTPAIAARTSEHLEFLNDDKAFLVDVEGGSEATAEEEMFEGTCGAEPNRADLRRVLRQVFSERGEARQRALCGRQEALEKWDWDVVIEEWADEFRRLLEQCDK